MQDRPIRYKKPVAQAGSPNGRRLCPRFARVLCALTWGQDVISHSTGNNRSLGNQVFCRTFLLSVRLWGRPCHGTVTCGRQRYTGSRSCVPWQSRWWYRAVRRPPDPELRSLTKPPYKTSPLTRNDRFWIGTPASRSACLRGRLLCSLPQNLSYVKLARMSRCFSCNPPAIFTIVPRP